MATIKKIKDIETALLQFETSSDEHGKATEEGNYKITNNCYKLIVKSIEYLNEHESIEELTKFLFHKSIGVRMWAATYLLPVLEKEGKQILNEIANSKGIHSFTAKMTISEWNKGNLKL